VLNLLFKDLLIQKKNFLFALFYLIFLIFVFQEPPMSDAVYATNTVVIVYLFTTCASSYDDKNRSEVLLNSLPVRRREIVLAKYLSTFLYAVIGLAGTIFFMAVLDAAGLKSLGRMPGLQEIVGSLSAAVLLNSVYYPLYFKFGAIKVRLFSIIVFVLIFLLPGFLVGYFKSHSSGEAAVGLVTAVLNTPGWLQGSAIAVLLLAVLLVSLVLSLKIYKNKEL
jgi:hypothetical protein